MEIEGLYGLKGNDSKRANFILFDFYYTKTGLDYEECFCSKKNRLKFNDFFFEWLEKNKELLNEEGN